MKKIVFNVLGMLCLVVGIVNRFIPGLPTTPLIILASLLFAKVNPRMQAWLLRSKFLGPYLDNYYNKKGMPTAYKLRTCAFMWAGMCFSVTLISFWPVQLLVPAIGVAVTAHVFSAKKRTPDETQAGWGYHLGTLALCWIWLGLGFFFADAVFAYVLLGIAAGVITMGIAGYAAVSRSGSHKRG